MQKVERARNTVLAAVSAPALPLAAMTLPLTIFLPQYYATKVGVNLAVVGIVFTVVRLADLIFDPMVGNLIDRTVTRFGAYKPWLVAGAPVVMAGSWMLFVPPPGASPLYLATALIITYAGYSILVLAQMGLSSAVTHEYSERSRVFAWWQLFNTSGTLLVLTLPLLFSKVLGFSGDFTVPAMGGLVVVAMPITILIVLAMVPSTTRPQAAHDVRFSDFVHLLNQRSARLVIGSVALTGLAFGTSSAVFVFFYTTVKSIPTENFSLLLIIAFIVMIAASPFWAWLGNRIGKHRALALGGIGGSTFYLTAYLVPPGNMALMTAAFVLNGFANCAGEVMSRAMMADASDEDRLQSGNDRTGMLFALLAIAIKLGQAFAIGLVFVTLDIIGFKAAAGTANSTGALSGVAFLACLLPAAFQFGAAMLALRYPLTAARHAEILFALDEQSHSETRTLGAEVDPDLMAAAAQFTGRLHEEVRTDQR